MATTMKLHKNSISCLTLITISLIYMPQTFLFTEAVGFNIDLIHRNSLQPPSLHYSSHQLVTNSLRRSFNRHRTLLRRSASTEIIPDRGEYLMKLSLGTPPVETLAIADTGSDLTWVQCRPCISCFKQRAPLFAPSRSSTYKRVSCSSNACNSLSKSNCDGAEDGPDGICRYEVRYGDNSFSKGELATETVTLGSTAKEKVTIPSVTIGCGHSDQGTFGTGTSGIVGLGGGAVSLITQMGSSIQGKFSYCLIPFFGATPRSKGSKLSFGDEAVVAGADVVTTPIIAKNPKTFYFLTLEGVTVGDQRLDLDPSSSSSSEDRYSDSDGNHVSSEGNIIIDSGTTLTFLPEDLFHQVVTAVKRQVILEQVDDPQGLLKLCYLSSGNRAAQVPEITVHFKGADVRLKSVNTFVKTSEDSLCLAFAPATTLAIYGNLAQMNFLVGYDLQKKTVSFKPTDCSGKA